MDMTGARRVASRFLGRGVIDQLRSIEYRLPGWPVPSIHEPVLSALSGTSDREEKNVCAATKGAARLGAGLGGRSPEQVPGLGPRGRDRPHLPRSDTPAPVSGSGRRGSSLSARRGRARRGPNAVETVARGGGDAVHMKHLCCNILPWCCCYLFLLGCSSNLALATSKSCLSGWCNRIATVPGPDSDRQSVSLPTLVNRLLYPRREKLIGCDLPFLQAPWARKSVPWRSGPSTT